MQRKEPVATTRFLAAQFDGSWGRSAAVRVDRQATLSGRTSCRNGYREAVDRKPAHSWPKHGRSWRPLPPIPYACRPDMLTCWHPTPSYGPWWCLMSGAGRAGAGDRSRGRQRMRARARPGSAAPHQLGPFAQARLSYDINWVQANLHCFTEASLSSSACSTDRTAAPVSSRSSR